MELAQERDSLKKQLKALQKSHGEDLKKLQAQVQELRGGQETGQGTSQDTGDAGVDDAEDVDKAIEQYRGYIKRLESDEHLVPGTEGVLEGFKKKLAEAEERKREGQPLHQRLRHLERKIDAKEAAVAKHKDKLIPDVEKAMGKLQEKLEQHRAKLDEEEKELRELCAKRDSAVREERSQPVIGLEGIKGPDELAGFCQERIRELLAAFDHPFCTGGSAQWCKQTVGSIGAVLANHAQPPQVVPTAGQHAQRSLGICRGRCKALTWPTKRGETSTT